MMEVEQLRAELEVLRADVATVKELVKMMTGKDYDTASAAANALVKIIEEYRAHDAQEYLEDSAIALNEAYGGDWSQFTDEQLREALALEEKLSQYDHSARVDGMVEWYEKTADEPINVYDERDLYEEKIAQLLERDYGLTLNDIDEQFIENAFKDGQKPADFVNWYGEAYDLEKINR